MEMPGVPELIPEVHHSKFYNQEEENKSLINEDIEKLNKEAYEREKKDGKLSKWATQNNWNSTNTELLFNHENIDNHLEVSPEERKANQLRSKNDVDKPYYNLIHKKKTKKEIMQKQVAEFYEDLNKKFKNSTKPKKNLDLASNAQFEKNFYINANEKIVNHKEIGTFEINNINYHKFNLEDFKSEYLKNG